MSVVLTLFEIQPQGLWLGFQRLGPNKIGHLGKGGLFTGIFALVCAYVPDLQHELAFGEPWLGVRISDYPGDNLLLLLDIGG